MTALMKRQWGQNLIKFRGVKLPGGLELNGREIYEDGQRDLDVALTKLKEEYELPPLNFVGQYVRHSIHFFYKGSPSGQR